MYQEFFGFRELPFELTPNPKFLFLTKQLREALSTLEYGLSSAKGITALIGEAGTGKTTLIHSALTSERCESVNCIYLMNMALSRDEFIETLSLRFDLSQRARTSKAALLHELESVLRERRARGEVTALVIDEAQSLSYELLEEVRLLANIESSSEKLLPLVLAGQPELKDRLNEQALRQLKQRVTLRCELSRFTEQETAAYIVQRVRIAGGDATKIFTRAAVLLVHKAAGGIPRTISVMCDNALLTACGLGRTRVDADTVLEVARDFDLGEGKLAALAAAVREQVAERRPADGAPAPAPAPAAASAPALTPASASQPKPVLREVKSPALEVPVPDVETEPEVEKRSGFRFSLFGRR